MTNSSGSHLFITGRPGIIIVLFLYVNNFTRRYALITFNNTTIIFFYFSFFSLNSRLFWLLSVRWLIINCTKNNNCHTIIINRFILFISNKCSKEGHLSAKSSNAYFIRLRSPLVPTIFRRTKNDFPLFPVPLGGIIPVPSTGRLWVAI